MIIDSHAHIFPYLGGPSGFESAEVHLYHCQRAMHNHLAQPVRRADDHSIVKEPTLWDPDKPGPEGRKNVDFRAGKYGRFEWTKDGVDYYIQYMPPYLHDMTAPPELLIASMDYTGIDKAVLAGSRTYGFLNNYYMDAVSRYPNRLIGLAQVTEGQAHTDEEISRLRHAVTKGGLKGLFFDASSLPFEPIEDSLADRKFAPFWETVVSLGIPVYWGIHPNSFLGCLPVLEKWVSDFPSVPTVISQGVPTEVAYSNGSVTIPKGWIDLVQSANMYIELAHPISHGRWEEYPYPVGQRIVKELYDLVGAEKLVWGSDFPNVERYCTYAQSLHYVSKHSPYMSQSDLELILGGNLAKVFRVE